MSEATDAAAIIAAINAQFSSPHAVEISDAPAQDGDHIVVFVSRRFVDGRMASGTPRIRGGRVITRYIGRRLKNVREMRLRTTAALESQTLAGDVGPFVYETEAEELRFDTEDGGWFVTADAWTY